MSAPGLIYQLAPFKNLSGETIPAFGCIRIGGTTRVNGVDLLKAYKPDATFYEEYAINCGGSIANNGYGSCHRYGDVTAACDTDSTPAYRDVFGPKPDSWLLWKGYPGFMVLDLVDTTNKYAKVRLKQIDQLYIKATAAIATNAVSTGSNYDIMRGTLGSETDAGFTTVPDFFNKGVAFANNDYGWLTLGPNGWHGGKRC